MPQINLAANENGKLLIFRLQVIDHKPHRVLTSSELNHLTSFRLRRALKKKKINVLKKKIMYRHISRQKEMSYYILCMCTGKANWKKKHSVNNPFKPDLEARRIFNNNSTTWCYFYNSETLFHKKFMNSQSKLRSLQLVYK